ncbi:spore coat protein [Aquibacillus sp. 3ASR75-11]|uniref:Spore coat protein n=1 Tax=Terrihalobacillus insolitus TaxID=2950438 RepID=A0A9X4ANP9_9BACI|nr:CotD family spore coat protein [Terrihalobacillus insolitus]MDC3413008.1 spore coat protein [Terrihalobacillus insolitus]MDC3424750.1 spore coat protein [Terrihalobacillus insolitus]
MAHHGPFVPHHGYMGPVKRIVHPTKHCEVHRDHVEHVEHVHPTHTTIVNHHLVKNHHLHPFYESVANTYNSIDINEGPIYHHHAPPFAPSVPPTGPEVESPKINPKFGPNPMPSKADGFSEKKPKNWW